LRIHVGVFVQSHAPSPFVSMKAAPHCPITEDTVREDTVREDTVRADTVRADPVRHRRW
jgi:hypothetical protein